MTLHKLLSAVTIGSGNNELYADGATATTCEIAAGTYYITNDEDGATDLLEAITDALEADAGGAWEARIVSGVVGLRCTDNAWEIDWAHADSTFDNTILGSTATSMSGASNTWDDADEHHKHGWYSTQWIESDSGVLNTADVTQHRVPSGAPTTVLHGDAKTSRNIGIAFEPIQKASPTSGYTNHDFKAFWDTANAGEGVRWYPDVDTTTVYAAYTNANGYYSGVFDADTCRDFAPARFAPGVSLWSWGVRILGT